MPGDLDDKIESSRKQSSEARRLLEQSTPPFQIFCKTVSGRTITINEVTPSTTVLEIMQKIEDKDGVPVDEQRLVCGGKQPDPSKTAAEAGIVAETTVHCLMRLRGGFGERKAIRHVVGLKMGRGNVGPDVIETEGKSFALKNFGRALKEDGGGQFRQKIQAKLGLDDPSFDTWWQKNAIHVGALIQETTHSGNCGDFAGIVASHLVAETEGQYVYEIVMGGRCDGTGCTFDKPGKHSFDHQLCVTYPMDDGTTQRNDQQMLALKLPQMNLKVATVADGWHNHRVITLEKWMQDGGNCYHAVTFKNLFIQSAHACGKSRLSKGERKKIGELVQTEIDTYTDPDNGDPQFLFDRFISAWDAAPKSDSAKEQRKEMIALALKMGFAWKQITDNWDQVFNERFRQLKGGFKDAYENYATAPDKPVYLQECAVWMQGNNWKDPALSGFLNAMKTQSGIDKAIHALMGAITSEKYFLKESRGLPTFDMEPMGPMLDERSTEDVSRQLATIPVDNWPLFVKEALALKDGQLVGYFLGSEANRDRVLTKPKVREKLYRTLAGSGSSSTAKALAHMSGDQFMAFTLSSDGAWKRVIASAKARLFGILSSYKQEPALLTALAQMDDPTFLDYADYTDASMKQLLSLPKIGTRLSGLLAGMSDGELQAFFDKLSIAQDRALLSSNTELRHRVMESDALRPEFFAAKLHETPLLISVINRYAARLSSAQLLLAFDGNPVTVTSDDLGRAALFTVMDGDPATLKKVFTALSPAHRKEYRGTGGSKRDRLVTGHSDGALQDLPLA